MPKEPTTYEEFFQQVLQQLGASGNEKNAAAALASVSHFEGANDYYNPLNVVQKEPGSSNFNSVGVQRYPDPGTGVEGTVALFKNNRIWDPVIQQLRTGTQVGILNAFDQVYRTWGSSGPVPISDSAVSGILSAPLKGGKFPANYAPSSPPSGPQGSGGTVVNLNDAITNVGTSEGTLVGGPVSSGGIESDVTGFLGDVAEFGAKAANPVAAAIGFMSAPLAAIAKFFGKLTWIFNIDHFIKFMLYTGGAVLAVTGFALIVFGAGKNEGEPAS